MVIRRYDWHVRPDLIKYPRRFFMEEQLHDVIDVSIMTYEPETIS